MHFSKGLTALRAAAPNDTKASAPIERTIGDLSFNDSVSALITIASSFPSRPKDHAAQPRTISELSSLSARSNAGIAGRATAPISPNDIAVLYRICSASTGVGNRPRIFEGSLSHVVR